MGPYLSAQTMYEFWHQEMERTEVLVILPRLGICEGTKVLVILPRLGTCYGVVLDVSCWENPPFSSFDSMLNSVVKT